MFYREFRGRGSGPSAIGYWPVVLFLAAAASVAAELDYALQPGDLIAITVYEEDALSAEVLVRPDGGISFPLIGDLTVAGRSTIEVKADVEARLAEYIPGASVTVAVLQTTGNRVFVIGKVNAPGAYPIYRPLDVMQALALAGGTAQFAELDNIRILRRGPDGQQEVLEFEYSEVVRGRNLEQNRLLMSGDTIVVP